MKRNYLAAGLLGMFIFPAIGCATPAEDLPAQPAVEPGLGLRDVNHGRWRKRGPAKMATGLTEDSSVLPDHEPTPDEVAHWTDKEWLEHVRPVAYFDGNEYELAEPDEAYLARWRIGRSLGQHPSGGPPPPAELKAGLTTRQVIGTDTRTVVGNPSTYPYRTIGVLNNNDVHASSANGACTMTLIGPSTAVAAASCFYLAGSGWSPGKSWGFGSVRTTASPYSQTFVYGTGVGSGCYWVTIPTAYTTSGSVFDNYAVIEFSNSQAPTCNLFPGNTLGWLGFWEATNAQIANTGGSFFEYPVNVTTNITTAYQWPTICTSTLSAGAAYVDPSLPTLVYHNFDSGNNGSFGAGVAQPIFGNGSLYITAINSAQSNLGTNNYGRRMDSTVTGFIRANSAL